MLSPFKSAISKWQISLITHKNTHLFKSVAENYGYKTKWADSAEGSATAPRVTKMTGTPSGVGDFGKLHIMLWFFVSCKQTQYRLSALRAITLNVTEGQIMR